MVVVIVMGAGRELSMKSAERKRIIAARIRELNKKGRIQASRDFVQHGTTSVYDHSIRVAYYSLMVAELLHLREHREELVRGALLHDYFLYDWHERDRSHNFHGFRHPFTALRNAKADFDLSEREQNIIIRHMFPLIPIPPACMEGWIVCMVDKGCSIYEMIRSDEV